MISSKANIASIPTKKNNMPLVVANNGVKQFFNITNAHNNHANSSNVWSSLSKIMIFEIAKHLSPQDYKSLSEVSRIFNDLLPLIGWPSLPKEMVFEIVKYLSPKDYKSLSEVNRILNKVLIGELKKDGNENILTILINLLFKGRVVNSSMEKPLLVLYLLTSRKKALKKCWIYKQHQEDVEATGVEYFLEYETAHFKSWLDEHQISIIWYDKKISNHSGHVICKFENLKAIDNKLKVSLNKSNFRNLFNQEIKVGKFINFNMFKIKASSAAITDAEVYVRVNIARIILQQYNEGNIKLSFKNRLIYQMQTNDKFYKIRGMFCAILLVFFIYGVIKGVNSAVKQSEVGAV
jgi:hypothetical protein